MMLENKVKTILAQGGTAYGTMIQEVRSPAIAQILAQAGFDFFFIDMEHGTYDVERAADIIRTARQAGIMPFVRVPDAVYHLISRVLDAGALGVMVPRVQTISDVRTVVDACRYPPVGQRGISTSRGHNDLLSAPLREFADYANKNVMVILQIERRTAIEHIDGLLSVPGVDVALIGPQDLALDLGVDDANHPAVDQAIQRVIEIARNHHVATGIHIRNIPALLKWKQRGMRVLTASTDVTFLSEGATATVKALRAS